MLKRHTLHHFAAVDEFLQLIEKGYSSVTLLPLGNTDSATMAGKVSQGESGKEKLFLHK